MKIKGVGMSYPLEPFCYTPPLAADLRKPMPIPHNAFPQQAAGWGAHARRGTA